MENAPTTDRMIMIGIRISFGTSTILEKILMPVKPPFGEGALEGLVAPESANNAAVGGACIPMLSMGIPGDAVTAIMLGAMYILFFQLGMILSAFCFTGRADRSRS